MLTRKQIEELLNATEELLSSLETKPEPTEGCCCPPDESTCDIDSDSELVSTPIEDLITNQINKHIKDGTFPTLNEAQAIHILDSINSKYN